MKRRIFLKSMGVLATSTLLPQNNAKPSQNLVEYSFEPLQTGESVLILGAGISGLVAAYKLTQKGISCKILEIQNRLGGRIFSKKISPESPLIVEMGAEWIGASHENIISLCKELNLTLKSHQFDENILLANTFYPESKLPKSLEWQKKLCEILEAYKKNVPSQNQKLDETTWWRFLKDNGIPENDLLMRELTDSTDFGEAIRNVSALSALSEYAYSSSKNEMDFKVEGGNSKMIEALAKKIGSENILMNKKAVQIIQKHNKVEVLCKNGERFEANRLVCSLPTYSVEQLSWLPNLPNERQKALKQLQYGRIIKIQVLFSERFWQNESFGVTTDTLAHFIFHTTQNQTSNNGILTAYATGDKAEVLSQMNEKQKIKAICEALFPIFGDVNGYAQKATSYYWGNDHYSFGAYAVYGVGQGALQKVLNQPFKNTIFIGEYLGEWQGFMEGAVQTGILAAEKLLKNLQK